MAWETPKIDWGAADGVSDFDMNRIEGNALALYEESARKNVTVYVSTSGNDSTGNGTSEAPYRTVGKALSVLPRDIRGFNVYVHIAAGAYTEAVSIKGFSGGVIRLSGANSAVTLTSLTIDNSVVAVTSLPITTTAAVGFILTNRGSLSTTGNLTANGTSTGLNISTGSHAHISGTLACPNASTAVNCSGSSTLYADAITGKGTLDASTGGVIAFNNSTLSRSTATGGRINTGGQGTGLANASLE